MLTPEQLQKYKSEFNAASTTTAPTGVTTKSGRPIGSINFAASSPAPEKSLLQKAGDFFTGSSQKFGNTLGTATSVIDKGAMSKVLNVLPGVSGSGVGENRSHQSDLAQKQVDTYLNLAREATDPAKKHKLLEAASQAAKNAGEDIFNNPEYQKTAKQVFGEGLGTAAEVLSFGSLQGAKVPALVAPVLKPSQRVVRGLAEGAKVGAAYGTTMGVADAMQENKSLGGIAKQGVSGGLAGAAFGGVLGAGASGVGNVLSGRALKAARNAVTPIEEGVEKVLKTPSSRPVSNLVDDFAKEAESVANPATPAAPATKLKQLEEYEAAAQEALRDYSKPTPLELAGRKAESALNSIKSQLDRVGQTKKEVTKSLSKVHTGDIVDNAIAKMKSDLKERVGLVYSGDSFKNAAGRLSTVSDRADLGLIRTIDLKLKQLSKNPTFQRVDDAVDYMQDLLYKRSGNTAIPINSKVEGVIKNVIGELNGKLKEIGGDKYSKYNNAYAHGIEVYETLNKALGIDGNKGASLMKQLFAPNGTAPRKLFENIKDITGIDLVDEATLAKFVMENAGDVRQASLLEQVIKGNVPTNAGGLIQRAGEWTIKKLQNPMEKAKGIANQAQDIKPPSFKQGAVPETALPKETAQFLREAKGLSAADITAKHPDIQLKRDVPITDIHGKKSVISEGEAQKLKKTPSGSLPRGVEAPKPVSEVDATKSLSEEAKKYKNADEFIKSQDRAVPKSELAEIWRQANKQGQKIEKLTPELRKYAQKYLNQGTPIKLGTIDIKDIMGTEGKKSMLKATERISERARGNPDYPIIVVEVDGKYVLLDGRNRITLLMERGQNKVNAIIAGGNKGRE